MYIFVDFTNYIVPWMAMSIKTIFKWHTYDRIPLGWAIHISTQVTRFTSPFCPSHYQHTSLYFHEASQTNRMTTDRRQVNNLIQWRNGAILVRASAKAGESKNPRSNWVHSTVSVADSQIWIGLSRESPHSRPPRAFLTGRIRPCQLLYLYLMLT